MKSYLLFVILFLATGCTSNPGAGEEKISETRKDPKEHIKESGMPDGKALYQTNCAVCHGSDGSGKEELYPPLSGSEYVSGDKNRLIGIVLNGMTGELKVGEKTYNSVMAPFSYLKDAQIAAILSWIRKEFADNPDAVSPEEVRQQR
ncbi:MAG: c-type cytochrome [Bacteroidota bacterium]